MILLNRMVFLFEIVVKLCFVFGEGIVFIWKVEFLVEGVLFLVKVVKFILKFKDSGIFLEIFVVFLFCLFLVVIFIFISLFVYVMVFVFIFFYKSKIYFLGLGGNFDRALMSVFFCKGNKDDFFNLSGLNIL